ncbi:UDP-N-acetylmuramoyl-tripeptide--D-alanyl-D-alanine ligase [Flavobacterium haoranii]|nr:UDP-N-acetylmuramoyl-tripeptide--D-alanyl-D-alanine ligase [Flavobacterium haoranii]
MKTSQLYEKFLETKGITTDTRNIQKDSMFFALKGEKFNANEFAKEALEKGAKYVVIDDSNYHIDNRTILVNNSLEALQKLANFHRKEINLTIVGLTGSNGKTTTKELFNVVLSKKFKTKATIGNLNNHIGVPLTLLSFTSETEIGIVEMGANHQKEIEFLCSIAEPNIGYITNFGKAHLEGFGGIEGIIKGKSELYDYLQNNNQKCIVNLDDPIQKEKTKNIERYTFSTKEKNSNVLIDNITANPMVAIEFENTIIQSNLIGIYNSNNINAAITLGKYFNISNEDIKNAIESYIPNNNRSQIIEKNSNKIILDAYNANPSSMEAALLNFFQLAELNKTAILGDMFELGEESALEHKKIIALCTSQKDVKFWLVGKHFYENQNDSNNIKFFKDFDSFSSEFKEEKIKNELFLIKGSRGMSLERTLDIL